MSDVKAQYTEEIKQSHERVFMSNEELYLRNYLYNNKELDNNVILDNIQQVKENINSVNKLKAETAARLINDIEGAEKDLQEVYCQLKTEENEAASFQNNLILSLGEIG